MPVALLGWAPSVAKDRPVGSHVALPLVVRHQPGVAQRVPELALLRGQAVDQQLDGFDGQQRRHNLGREVLAVVGVVRRVHDL